MNYKVVPIGYIKKQKSAYVVEILEEYQEALKGLDGFSHVLVFWWADKNDNKKYRHTLKTKPLYTENTVGVFSCRAEYRPNPIMLTTCEIKKVDEKKGIIIVSDIDAFPGTPVIDLKGYIPVCDRVKEVKVPKWILNWPEWLDDSFEPETESTDFESEGNSNLPNSGRLGRLGNEVEKVIGRTGALDIFSDYKNIKSKSSAYKSDWIEDVMIRLEKRVGKDKAIEIMQECGSKCYDSIEYLQESAKEIKTQFKSMKELVNILNKKFSGTSRFILKDDTTIIGEQFRCYCMVKNTTKTFINLNYCQCSAGCRRRFFESILGRPVEVELLDSIVGGGKTCKYSIKVI